MHVKQSKFTDAPRVDFLKRRKIEKLPHFAVTIRLYFSIFDRRWKSVIQLRRAIAPILELRSSSPLLFLIAHPRMSIPPRRHVRRRHTYIYINESCNFS